jgi:hypothetical protein
MHVVLTFYRNFRFVASAITLFGCYLVVASESWLFVMPMFWTKIFTNVILGLLVNYFSADQFCFYANLGYNRIRLFALKFILDMVIWGVLSWLTIKIFL